MGPHGGAFWRNFRRAGVLFGRHRGGLEVDISDLGFAGSQAPHTLAEGGATKTRRIGREPTPSKATPPTTPACDPTTLPNRGRMLQTPAKQAGGYIYTDTPTRIGWDLSPATV